MKIALMALQEPLGAAFGSAARRAVLGRDGNDGRVGWRGCLPWSHHHPGTSGAFDVPLMELTLEGSR